MALDLFQDPLFLAFAQQRPVAVLAQLALRSLLDEAALLHVFQQHAQTQREAVIPFAALTQMMASVVLGQEPSVNAAIKKMHAQLGASFQAVYGKLQRVETATTRGLVQHSYARLRETLQALGQRRRHDVPGYQTRILDGNHLAATDHRLKETRTSTAAPLPGKTLVVYSPADDGIVDCVPIEDGHAQERSALDEVLPTVRARQLWVADRNFCTLKFLYGIHAAQAAFVIRQHGKLVGTPVGTPRLVGKTESATVLVQEFHLPEYAGTTLVLRRIIVRLRTPTRDGDTEVVLLTDLPEEVADALLIAEIYRLRWRIETVMQHLTDTLRCEIKPLCYPKAALFGFGVALVAYNALALVLAAVGAAHGRETSGGLSRYYLALEIAQASDGLLIALPPERWAGLQELGAAGLAEQLLRIARGRDFSYYAKNTRGPKKQPDKQQHERCKVHVSTKKLLDQRRQ